MYQGLLHTHWLLAVLLLIVLTLAVLKSAAGFFGNKPFAKMDNTLSLVTLILAHLQLVIGLVMYVQSPYFPGTLPMADAMADATLRFYSVEHITVNIIAIALITVGRAGSKRKNTDKKKFRHLLIFFGIGLLLILSRVPWERLFELPGA